VDNEGKTEGTIGKKVTEPSRMIAKIKDSDPEWRLIRETLQHRLDMEELIAGISTSFINLSHDEIDNEIDHVLQKIGEFADVDRSYVFLFYDNGYRMNNTHEWCAEGIEPQIQNLKRLYTDDFPWFMKKLKRFDVIHVPSVNELPSEGSAEKETFQMQSIKSLINVPMIYKSHLIGFLGFDSVRMEKIWPDEDIKLLRMVAEILVNALEHKRTEQELISRAHLAELGKEIGEAVTKSETLQNLLQRCAESIFQNLHAAFARIWTYNQREKVLELQASAGMYTHINGNYSQIPVGMYKIGRIAQTQKPHLTNRVHEDPEIHDREWASREKLVSFAGYPLIVENRLIGVMAMFSRYDLTDFTLKALATIADTIAIGIERKRAEKEKERLIRAIDKSSEGIILTDENDRYIYVNEAYVEIFGYSQDELIGKTWQTIAPHKVHIKKILDEKNRTFNQEGPGLTRDGKIIPIELNETGLWDDSNNYQGFVDIVRDISTRRQIEEKLLESEERYRTIIEYSNDMIWTLDTDGNFLYFNDRSEEITGFRLEDWRGKSFAPIIKKEELPKIIEVFHKTLGGEPQQYEVSIKSKEGRSIILFVNTAPIYSKGKVVGTVSFGRDVTEHKKAEEEIEESLKKEIKKSRKQKKLLCYLIEGTRGGVTRALILKHLVVKPCNAHQLTKALKRDYKTIRHHLDVLVKNGIVTRNNDGKVALYFLSKHIESDLIELDRALEINKNCV
jgi:PAS domain S-box-containing protein